MDIDQHLVWFRSVVKASVEGDTMSKDKLIKNVSSCFLRVKKALSGQESSEQQYEDFKIKATLLLLLCCPRVHQQPNVTSSADFRSLVSTLPSLQESDFFAVARSQKTYRLLVPLLSWLPPLVVKDIIGDYFLFVKDVTPVTLAISVELLRCFFFSCHYTSEEDVGVKAYPDCLKPLTEFLSSKEVSSETQATIKSSGYYYLYLCECLYLLLSAYSGHSITKPNVYLCIHNWSSLWRTRADEPTLQNCLLFTEVPIKSLLKLCQENNEAISVDVWMGWSETILPTTVQVHRLSIHEHVRTQPQSIQSVIRNIAYDILEVLSVLPELKEILIINKYLNLQEFLHQVALDPDYDPDQDLGTDQLVEEINKLLPKTSGSERLGKLLEMLVVREDVFSSERAQVCLRECRAKVASRAKVKLLRQFIYMVKAGKHYTPEWLDITLELAEDVCSVEVLAVVEECLSVGLDETLRTPFFSQNLTAVFNQVAGEDAPELKSGERVAWLCLQSGRLVVERAVTLAITLTGLVPVMIQSLSVIAPVCRATQSSGVSVLADSLLKQQERGLSEKEARDFVTLVRGLLKVPGNVLVATEVVNVLVKPFLVLKEGSDIRQLLLPLELLKAALSQDCSTLVKVGAPLPSLVVTLAQVANSTIYLQGRNVDHTITIRTQATHSLLTLAAALLAEKDTFHREITLLKYTVGGRYGLHPRTLHALSPLLEAGLGKAVDAVDHTLQAVMEKAEWGRPENMEGLLEEEGLSKDLEKVSRPQWITILIQLLPHSTKKEWTAGMFLTHRLLQSQYSVFPTLEIFQEVLYLLCSLLELPILPHFQPGEKESGGKKTKEEESNGEELSEDQGNVKKKREKEKNNGEKQRVNQEFVGNKRQMKENNGEEETDYPGNVQNRGEENRNEDEQCDVSKEEEKQKETSASLLSLPISIQHCFQCFASGAMIYIESTAKHLSASQRFVYLCSVFRWWCRRVPSYQCDPELPTLLLARLCATLEELVISGRVKIEAVSCGGAEVTGDTVMEGGTGTDTTRSTSRTVKPLGDGLVGVNGIKEEMINSFEEIKSVEGKIKLISNASEIDETKKGVSGNMGENVVMNNEEMLDKRESTTLTTNQKDKGRYEKSIECEDVDQNTQDISNTCRSFRTANDVTSPNLISLVNGSHTGPSLSEDSKRHFNSKGSTEVANRTRHQESYSDTVDQKLRTNSQEMKKKDFKHEVESLIWCVVKYVPPCHLVASVANKLKKLFEL